MLFPDLLAKDDALLAFALLHSHTRKPVEMAVLKSYISIHGICIESFIYLTLCLNVRKKAFVRVFGTKKSRLLLLLSAKFLFISAVIQSGTKKMYFLT